MPQGMISCSATLMTRGFCLPNRRSRSRQRRLSALTEERSGTSENSRVSPKGWGGAHRLDQLVAWVCRVRR